MRTHRVVLLTSESEPGRMAARHLAARLPALAVIVEKFEELPVLFVDANNFGGIVELQFRKKDRAFLAKLSESAAQGNSVRTGFVSRKALHEESFDFGGDGVLHAFGFGVRFGPR